MRTYTPKPGDITRAWDVIDAVSEIADAHGASRSQVALAWVGAQPAVTSVILGIVQRSQKDWLRESARTWADTIEQERR